MFFALSFIIWKMLVQITLNVPVTCHVNFSNITALKHCQQYTYHTNQRKANNNQKGSIFIYHVIFVKHSVKNGIKNENLYHGFIVMSFHKLPLVKGDADIIRPDNIDINYILKSRECKYRHIDFLLEYRNLSHNIWIQYWIN